MEEAIVNFATSLAQINTNAEKEKLLEYDIPRFLLLTASNVGSCDVVEKILHVLVPLSHLRKGSMKIMESGGVLVISQLLLSHYHHSNIILFGCKILSSIASLPGAQSTISNKVIPCLEEIVEKIAVIDNNIAPSSIAQLLNCLGVFGLRNYSNKILISSASIPQTLKLMLEQRNDAEVLGAYASMIANISFKNPCAAHNFLASDMIDTFIQKAVEKLSVGINDDELEKVLMMISNLSNSQENSSLLYCIEGIVEFVVHLLQQSEKVNIIRNASIACASMSYDSPVTRRHFLSRATIEALVDIVLRMGMGLNETQEDKEESKAANAATWALISLASDVTSLQRIGDNLQDFQALIQLYLQTGSEDVLLSGSMLMSALLPSLDNKKALVTEGRISLVENQGGGLILKRCMNDIFFCDEALFPKWFSSSLAILGTNIVNDENIWNEQHYYDQTELFQCIMPEILK